MKKRINSFYKKWKTDGRAQRVSNPLIEKNDRGRIPHFFAKRSFRPFKRPKNLKMLEFALEVLKLPEGAL